MLCFPVADGALDRRSPPRTLSCFSSRLLFDGHLLQPPCSTSLDLRWIAAGSTGSKRSTSVYPSSLECWRCCGWSSVYRKLGFGYRSGSRWWLNLGQIQPGVLVGLVARRCRCLSATEMSLPSALSTQICCSARTSPSSSSDLR